MNTIDNIIILFYGIAFVSILYYIYMKIIILDSPRILSSPNTIQVYNNTIVYPDPRLWPWSVSYNWWPYWGYYIGGSS